MPSVSVAAPQMGFMPRDTAYLQSFGQVSSQIPSFLNLLRLRFNLLFPMDSHLNMHSHLRPYMYNLSLFLFLFLSSDEKFDDNLAECPAICRLFWWHGGKNIFN